MRLSDIHELIALRHHRRKWRKLVKDAMSGLLAVTLDCDDPSSMITLMPVREAIRNEAQKQLDISMERLNELGVEDDDAETTVALEGPDASQAIADAFLGDQQEHVQVQRQSSLGSFNRRRTSDGD